MADAICFLEPAGAYRCAQIICSYMFILST